MFKKVRYTIDSLHNGITNAVTELGEEVIVEKISDPLLIKQDMVMKYERHDGEYDYKGRKKMRTTFVNADGKVLKDSETVLDLYQI